MLRLPRADEGFEPRVLREGGGGPGAPQGPGDLDSGDVTPQCPGPIGVPFRDSTRAWSWKDSEKTREDVPWRTSESSVRPEGRSP